MSNLFEDGYNLINAVIEDRTQAAKELARRFQDLRGLPYAEFLERMLDMGLDLDFVTSCEMHKALNAPTDTETADGER